MPGVLVHDGYTLEGKIEAKPPLVSEINFRYRPALPDTMNEWRLQNAKAGTGHDVTTALVRVLEKCIVSWDVMEKASVLTVVLGRKTGEGDELVTVPVVESTLRALPDSLLNRIFSVVISYGPKEQEADAKN